MILIDLESQELKQTSQMNLRQGLRGWFDKIWQVVTIALSIQSSKS